MTTGLPHNDDIRRRLDERTGADGYDAYHLLSAIGRDCVTMQVNVTVTSVFIRIFVRFLWEHDGPRQFVFHPPATGPVMSVVELTA